MPGKLGGRTGSWERSYVGLRLTNLPSDGTKREFWTLVMDDSVATSGSVVESS